jgi:hypothetical protein
MVKTERRTTHRFRVGDRVEFVMGRRKVIGVITEDRGLIGAHGRRLFQVQVPMDPYEPALFELPADEIQTANSSEASRTLGKNEIVDYLKNGGLIAILQSNLGGKDQPRVWLCRDNLGNVTHTFISERGLLGGATVPFWTLHEGSRVFSDKKDEVTTYLTSFGLSHEEAELIVHAVGTAPWQKRLRISSGLSRSAPFTE